MAATAERCSWCGGEVELGDGFRAYEPAGDRRAVFCRLEHVVPWTIQGARWEAGPMPTGEGGAREHCAWCEEELGDVHVVLVRHRSEHRVPDSFCDVEHLSEWAKEGGRWR